MNLICICLDTFRADIVGPGKKFSHVSTPNLDAFASEAIRFTQAYGEGQPTLQTRRSLFTGQRSFPWRYNFDRRGHWHHAAGWHKIPPEQDTLAEILLSHGYLTGLVADTYHMFKPTMNFSRGFAAYDFIRGQEGDNWRFGSTDAIESAMRRHVREPIDWDAQAGLRVYLHNQAFRKSEEDYSCARVFGRASEWLEENATNAPFFLWVDSFDPHEPWDPPPSYADAYFSDYDGPDFINPGSAGPDASDAEKERIKALYFGEVTFVDKWIGQFLAQVDRLGLKGDTLVLVMSDHGTQVLDHGKFGKGPDQLHPFNTQLNFMFRHPGVTGGRDVSGFVQTHDLLPTVLPLLGIDAPPVDGADFWPLVTGEQSSIRDVAITGWAGWAIGRAGGRAAVRTDDWNYTVTLTGPDREEQLFDTAADPDEVTNVAADHAKVTAELRGHVEALIVQKLPATFNEVCAHPVPGPGAEYLSSRRSQAG